MLYIVQTALQLGCIYSFVALALFLSYRILQIADLTTDGCFVLGMAVSIVFTIQGHPVLGVFMGMLLGGVAGLLTALLQTYFGVPSILAGIITNTGLYTVNLMVMGWSSNLSILKNKTILMRWFLSTRLGLSIRATGDNIDMVSSSSINPKTTIIIGLILSNMLTGLSGAMASQLQKSADINAGTGIVTVGLATLIIGETLVNGKKSITRNIVACLVGNIIYRCIYAFVLQSHIIPIECLKLMTAVIITLAIAIPYIQDEKRRKTIC